jgi:hypothetical protein
MTMSTTLRQTAIRASGRKGRKLCTTWEVIGEAYTLFRMRIAPARSAEAALVVLRGQRESGTSCCQRRRATISGRR